MLSLLLHPRDLHPHSCHWSPPLHGQPGSGLFVVRIQGDWRNMEAQAKKAQAERSESTAAAPAHSLHGAGGSAPSSSSSSSSSSDGVRSSSSRVRVHNRFSVTSSPSSSSVVSACGRLLDRLFRGNAVELQSRLDALPSGSPEQRQEKAWLQRKKDETLGLHVFDLHTILQQMGSANSARGRGFGRGGFSRSPPSPSYRAPSPAASTDTDNSSCSDWAPTTASSNDVGVRRAAGGGRGRGGNDRRRGSNAASWRQG